MIKQVASQNIGNLKCLLALSLINTIGPLVKRRLLAAFPVPEAIFNADTAAIADAASITTAQALKIRRFDAWGLVDAQMSKAERLDVRIVTLFDKEYPASLRPLDDAPVLLYVKGSMREDDHFALAMVGSRITTEYGRKVADALSYELAASGLTIVSGMARGIDTISHKGALQAGGRSIAVLGSGIDIVYPPENKELMDMLCRSGCAISEFPLGTPPARENFPRRNRLISGLSLGVLVIEAAARSGSLITARCALEQGKEVFAVPGNINSSNSQGTNNLIKMGATPVQGAKDILAELAPMVKGLLRSRPHSVKPEITGRLAITDEEKAICKVLGNDSRHIDALSRELRIPPARLAGLLLGLEMKGIIRQTGGNNFSVL